MQEQCHSVVTPVLASLHNIRERTCSIEFDSSKCYKDSLIKKEMVIYLIEGAPRSHTWRLHY